MSQPNLRTALAPAPASKPGPTVRVWFTGLLPSPRMDASAEVVWAIATALRGAAAKCSAETTRVIFELPGDGRCLGMSKAEALDSARKLEEAALEAERNWRARR